MKKALLLLLVLLISIPTLAVISLYALIQSSYAPQLVSKFAEHFTHYSIEAKQVTYSPPLQITLEDATFTHQEQTTRIPKITAWINQIPWQNGKLTFDSLLIEGANLDITDLETDVLKTVQTHQLALKQTDISAPRWSARGLNLQVDQPSWASGKQTFPFGDIQLSADQLYIQGEAFNDLLVDMRYQQTDSTIFGSSFRWRGASISGQAEQYTDGWSLINVTIDKLTLPSETPLEQLLTTMSHLSLPVNHINSLDILNGSFDYAGWRFEQLDASLENLTLNHSLWQQSDGYASFNAESINNLDIQLYSPRAQLGFRQDHITIEEFDGDFKQGRVQLQGDIRPDKVALKQLRLSGVKWLEDAQQLIPNVQQLLAPLNHLSIEELDVENAQIIQVDRKPYWQLSGLNINGEHLVLINDGKLGLLNGQIEISANSANLDSLISTQAHLKASSQQGVLTLNRLFIPLEQGYVEATGQWDRTTLSAPWQVQLHADGIPLSHFYLQHALPFSLSGFAEMELELKGLSGDYSMLAHSLSGHVRGYLRQASIEAKSGDGEQTYQHNLTLEQIELNADRGRIGIVSDNENDNLAGSIDLTKSHYSTILLHSKQACHELWSDILSRANVIKKGCSDTPLQPIKQIQDEGIQTEVESDSLPSTAL
ncbi:AsmA family protein [Vibrio sp. RE86]|uniref:AsmA family protein n=1 Tax=Vibrio sp. RE86 TaxID=2607605 RepID=UPI0014937B32|nr:AsmA family protein [Vibrio sp. RE86]